MIFLSDIVTIESRDSSFLKSLYLKLIPCKRVQPQALNDFSSILANFLLSIKNGDTPVVVCRDKGLDNNGISTRIAIRVIDSLVSAGYLLIENVGKQADKLRTRYQATQSLKDLFTLYMVRLQLKRGDSFSFWRKQDGTLSEFKGDSPARAHNAHFATGKHLITYTSDEDGTERIYPNFVRQVFADRKKTLLGRFYPYSCQSLRKTERATIRINGKETTEIDFVSLHPAILYAREGLPLPKDPYLVDGFDKSIGKALALSLINCSSYKAFMSGALASARATGRTYKLPTGEVKKGKQVFATYSTWGYDKKTGKSSLYGLDSLDFKHWYNLFLEKHRPIAHHFHSDDLSLKLQNTDSEIMTMIIEALQEDDQGYVMVHDSLVVDMDYSAQLASLMRSSSLAVTGFSLEVD